MRSTLSIKPPLSAMMHNEAVKRRGWLTDHDENTDIGTLSLEGGNQMHLEPLRSQRESDRGREERT
jgi:hypothetical protein